MDYKEWMQNRAEEIANTLYDMGFYDLSKEHQEHIYALAQLDYTSYNASLIDRAREYAKYNQIGNKYG